MKAEQNLCELAKQDILNWQAPESTTTKGEIPFAIQNPNKISDHKKMQTLRSHNKIKEIDISHAETQS